VQSEGGPAPEQDEQDLSNHVYAILMLCSDLRHRLDRLGRSDLALTVRATEIRLIDLRRVLAAEA
jgi:hypothetical protein